MGAVRMIAQTSDKNITIIYKNMSVDFFTNYKLWIVILAMEAMVQS